jgi:hypothetical protein
MENFEEFARKTQNIIMTDMDNTFVVSIIANRVFESKSICGSGPWKWNWAAGYILDIVVSRKGILLATKVYRRAAHTGHSFDFHSIYPMSKKGESFKSLHNGDIII